MKETNFEIPFYGTKVKLVKIERQSDANLIDNVCRQEELPTELIQEITDNTATKNNGAITCFNKGKNCTMVVFYRSENKERLMRSMCHEKRHVEDDIVSLCGIKDDDEAVAYLAGFLGVKFYNFLFK